MANSFPRRICFNVTVLNHLCSNFTCVPVCLLIFFFLFFGHLFYASITLSKKRKGGEMHGSKTSSFTWEKGFLHLLFYWISLFLSMTGPAGKAGLPDLLSLCVPHKPWQCRVVTETSGLASRTINEKICNLVSRNKQKNGWIILSWLGWGCSDCCFGYNQCTSFHVSEKSSAFLCEQEKNANLVAKNYQKRFSNILPLHFTPCVTLHWIVMCIHSLY